MPLCLAYLAITLLVGLGERADILNRTVEITHDAGLDALFGALMAKSP